MVQLRMSVWWLLSWVIWIGSMRATGLKAAA